MVGIFASSDPSAFTRKVQTFSPLYSETARVPPSVESAIPLGPLISVAAVTVSPVLLWIRVTFCAPVSVM